ncbi:hypothetical protein B0A48_15623 [Cryoendolithus antarcticus]|uniref:Helicase ATP-binding domain-containing protein n=1 Tax=Cryoendolithus antarcticus TaxID=1507870 RepID=A0A1V8SGU3_9PEZI|nr:hypothetical protein B0A48_15623 [Cryoendolithus antarcticus]
MTSGAQQQFVDVMAAPRSDMIAPCDSAYDWMTEPKQRSPVRGTFKPLNTLAAHTPPFHSTAASLAKAGSVSPSPDPGNEDTSPITRILAGRSPSRSRPPEIQVRTTQAGSIHRDSAQAAGQGSRMVSERDPSRTSSSTYLSPQKQDHRLPLANISAKMQSPSPQASAPARVADNVISKPSQPQFGTASPLRNPLQKKKPDPFFVPQVRTTYQRSPPVASAATQRTVAPPVPVENRAFYLPGQVPRPTNPPNATTQRAPAPMFSSLGPKTTYQPFVPPRQVVDLTRKDDDEDRFDPDAAIRAESRSFGAADPYMYVDSAQASENLKNLLEGAFDDEEEKSSTRLRTRAARKATKEAEKQTKSLAAQLAALEVKVTKKEEAEEEEAEEDEEDGTVEGLTVKLLPHQVEGVKWMIDKEIGQRKRNGVLPHGGILADDMGLGKTVQSVALLLTNPRPAADAKPDFPKQKMPGKGVTKCTLVVAPLALIKQWEGEIKSKVTRSHSMKVLIHHGPSRTKSAAELKKYDVVITTYQILASEHAGSSLDRPGGPRIGCFGVHWYRLILDEAHTIKNRNAKSTQACYALESWYRWCLTGTPMQNNLDELQSLIKFLRVKPYCEMSEWKNSITGPMKNGRGGIAMKRLQLFLQAFMKRRTKNILKKEGALNFGGKTDEDGKPKSGGMQIVKREVFTTECVFDDAEQQFYDRLSARAESRLKDIQESGKGDYIGALVILLRLRQACNHPHLIEAAMSKDKDALTTGSTQSGAQTPRKMKVDTDEMDDLASLMGGVTVQNKSCDVCQADLSAQATKSGAGRCEDCEEDLRVLRGKERKKKQEKRAKRESIKTEESRAAPARRNRKVLIDSDDEDDAGEWIAAGPERYIDYGRAGGTDDEDAEGGGDTLGSVDTGDEDSEPSDSVSENDEDSGPDSPIIGNLAPSHKPAHKPSTKIRHLLRILHAETPKHKTIVFSQFTSMLDLIEPHMRHASIRFVRYDGSMRPDAREASLNSLKTDPKTRVLLCSLKCGSLGLNLTAASRVVIVEPFWNPFVEEQAIDRVHRLNQTVDVKVFRLTVLNTVEERILALQEKKRELAAAALEGGKTVGKLSMQDIMSLFRRDAEIGGSKEDVEFEKKFGKESSVLHGERSQEGGFVSGVAGDARGGGEAIRGEHAIFGRRW